MMEPEPVLDMRKVAWVTDKFGVTWHVETVVLMSRV